MKQLIRKILKEQDEVINVPDLDFFDGDWEELLRFTKGRKFRVRGDLDFPDICPKTLGNLISVDGDLRLRNCDNLVSLGLLEHVGGFLGLNNCPNLTSLGNLKYVGNTLSLAYCRNLLSFENLEYVGGNFFAYGTKIADTFNTSQIREMITIEGLIIL
jgi:hypothetical protein